MPNQELRAKDVVTNLASLALVLGVIYLFAKVFSIEDIRTWIEGAGIWAPLALVVAKVSTIVIAPIGGAPLYPIAGAVFGFWKALALLTLGDAIGGTIAFYLSRFFGRSIAERMMGKERGLLAHAIEIGGTPRGFLLTRLSFFALQEAAAYAAGLTRLKFLPFILIHMAIGIIPTTLMTALGTILTEDTSVLVFGLILGGGAVVSAIAMLTFFTIVQKRKDEEDKEKAGA